MYRQSRLIAACAVAGLSVAGCTVRFADDPAPRQADLNFLAEIQLCRSASELRSSEHVSPREEQEPDSCGLTPVPDGHAIVRDEKTDGVLWEGEIARDGTFEATFDSTGRFHVEISSPVLERPLVSETYTQKEGVTISAASPVETFVLDPVTAGGQE